MTIVAIPYWDGRISPVFDVSATGLIVTISEGREQNREQVIFCGEELQTRVRRLVETRAAILICGGISRPLEMAVRAAGIEVISQVCGEVEAVLTAFIGGYLNQDAFRMPGCTGGRR